MNNKQTEGEDPVPIFKTWNTWYAFVIGFLVILIIFFTFFTKAFA